MPPNRLARCRRRATGPAASDDAMILYTSGSTSKPKAIAARRITSIVENSFNIGERQGLRSGRPGAAVAAVVLDLSAGSTRMPATFSHGATLVLQGRFDAGEALRPGGAARLHRRIYTLPGMTDDDRSRHPGFTAGADAHA